MPDLTVSQGTAGYRENITCKSAVEKNVKLLYRLQL